MIAEALIVLSLGLIITLAVCVSRIRARRARQRQARAWLMARATNHPAGSRLPSPL